MRSMDRFTIPGETPSIPLPVEQAVNFAFDWFNEPDPSDQRVDKLVEVVDVGFAENLNDSKLNVLGFIALSTNFDYEVVELYIRQGDTNGWYGCNGPRPWDKYLTPATKFTRDETAKLMDYLRTYDPPLSAELPKWLRDSIESGEYADESFDYDDVEEYTYSPEQLDQMGYNEQDDEDEDDSVYGMDDWSPAEP